MAAAWVARTTVAGMSRRSGRQPTVAGSAAIAVAAAAVVAIAATAVVDVVVADSG